MSYRYGMGPSSVVTDPAGNVVAGAKFQVWSAPEGARVYSITQVDGSPTDAPGVVVSDAAGRVRFTETTEQWGSLSLRDGDGNWWTLVSEELLGQTGAMARRFSQVEQAALGAVQKGTLTVNARDHGADPAASDNTGALQRAMTAAQAGNAFGAAAEVFVPAGVYRTRQLNVPSRTTIRGTRGTTLYNTEGGYTLSVSGSVGAEVGLAQHLTDTTVTTRTAHGLKVGDLVYLKSQRDALSTDTGPEWRLGYATPNSGACHFAEFGTVDTVQSTTVFTLAALPTFPSYRADNTQETSTNARSFATVQKVTPAEQVTLADLTLTGLGVGSVATRWAKGVQLDRLEIRPDRDAPAVLFRESLDCDAADCSTYYPPTIPSSLTLRNAFKATSSQSCGFTRCYVEHGTQCFDLTYNAGSGPSTFCYFNDCSTWQAQNNAITSHGGSYACQVNGGRFTACRRNGILLRSRNSTVDGAHVTGLSGGSTYGISVYEGWAVDCTVTGNQITTFGAGIQVLDATDPGEQFDWVGLLAVGNVITNCDTGVDLAKAATNSNRGESGIIIDHNSIRRLRTSSSVGVKVGSYVTGASIYGNTIDGDGRATHGVLIDVNATDIRVSDNTILRCGTGIEYRGATDPAITPRLYRWNNVLRGITGSNVKVSNGAQVLTSGNEGTATA